MYHTSTGFFFEMKRLSPNQSSIHSIILLLVVTFRFEYSDLPTFAAPVTAVHLNNCPIRLACSDKVVSRVLCDINDHRRARGVLVGLLTLWWLYISSAKSRGMWILKLYISSQKKQTKGRKRYVKDPKETWGRRSEKHTPKDEEADKMGVMN